MRRKLKYLIDRASRDFGDDNIRVLEYHISVIIKGDIWSVTLDEPIRFINALEEIFGSREAAKNIISQIFFNAFSELDNAKLYVDEVIKAIEDNDSLRFRKIITDLFDMLSKRYSR